MIRQRIMTAVVLVVVLVGGIYLLPAPWLVAAIGLVFLGGFWEFAGFLGHSRGAGRLPLVVAGAAAMALTFWWVVLRGGSPQPILVTAAVWWLVAFAWILRFPTPVPRAAIRVAPFLVVLPGWLGLSVLALRPEDGGAWLFCAFALVWAADTGAYFSGRALGRHKLAPSVSPGKTWEGLGGGLAVAMLVAVAIAWLLHAPLWPFVGLAAVAVLASVVGDLTISAFKRHAGVKDSGRLFPGHGGILDRLDSVCAAGPVLALGLALLLPRG